MDGVNIRIEATKTPICARGMVKEDYMKLYLTSRVGRKTERTGTARRSQRTVARAAPTRPQTAVNEKLA